MTSRFGFLALLLLLGTFVKVFAQADSTVGKAQPEVILTELSQPLYPPLARQAWIAGEVKNRLLLKQDGAVESTEVVSGHVMLRQAALESTQKSHFECRGCSKATAEYFLTFVFKINNDGDCCKASLHESKITQSGDHIFIEAPAKCLCDPSATVTKVRSSRCLYLWKCGWR